MAGTWDQPGIPHRGWWLVGCSDLGEAEHVCEMCGTEKIRYVHEVAHYEHDNLLVGCVCAEKMTEDRIGPKRAERRVKSLAERKANWVQKTWRVSAAGNPYRNVAGFNIGVFEDRFRPNRWKWRIGKRFSSDLFASPEEAKGALFDTLIREGKLRSRARS